MSIGGTYDRAISPEGKRKARELGREAAKASACADCNGTGYIKYMQRGSVSWWHEQPASRPCQKCNLKAFGLTEDQLKEFEE